MPVLENARHEKFAQVFVKGKAADEASSRKCSTPVALAASDGLAIILC
ncbi:hypothetical protein C8J35_103511 [Rhizobium sp. PP-F2F-G38]|nr:hypothetical protein C8J35_103511 [Rhizobium sp. PP-F2F-G38]